MLLHVKNTCKWELLHILHGITSNYPLNSSVNILLFGYPIFFIFTFNL